MTVPVARRMQPKYMESWYTREGSEIETVAFLAPSADGSEPPVETVDFPALAKAYAESMPHAQRIGFQVRANRLVAIMVHLVMPAPIKGSV